jgi:hypothetical protein
MRDKRRMNIWRQEDKGKTPEFRLDRFGKSGPTLSPRVSVDLCPSPHMDTTPTVLYTIPILTESLEEYTTQPNETSTSQPWSSSLHEGDLLDFSLEADSILSGDLYQALEQSLVIPVNPIPSLRLSPQVKQFLLEYVPEHASPIIVLILFRLFR